jgi:cobalamin biosynthesis protein CbiG
MAGVSARVGEDVPRRGDEKDVGPLFHVLGLDPHTGNLLNVVDEKVEHVLEGVGLDAQMVAGFVAVGDRCGDPVDVQTQQVQQLPPHDGDLGGVDAIGAVDRAASALGALKEIVPPLFQDI